MRIEKRVVFAAAHSITGAGKCENKHGHNWIAEITVDCNTLDDRGFVADVGDIKQAAFKYDHDDLDKYFKQPSTENVAQQIAEDTLEICQKCQATAKFHVTVHLIETENNSATATTNTISRQHVKVNL